MSGDPGTLPRVVVLAAGRGSRLGTLTAERPKPLLAIGSTTLLDRLLDQCATRGLHDVTVVAGFGHDLVAEHVARRAAVELALNSAWAVTGSARSLLLGWRAGAGDRPLLLLHGDLWLADEALDTLLAAATDARAAALVDPTWRVETGDEVVARWEGDGRLSQIAKRGRPGVVAGTLRAAFDADERARDAAETARDAARRERLRPVTGRYGTGWDDELDEEPGPAPEPGRLPLPLTAGHGEYVGALWLPATVAAALAAHVARRLREDPTLNYEEPLLDELLPDLGLSPVTATREQWRNVNDGADLAWVRDRMGGEAP